MEVTVNTTNNENAKITVDEKAIVSLVQELVARDKAPINFSNAFEAVYNNMKQKAQERVQQYWDASQATTPTAPVPPVPPVPPTTVTTQPIAEADVPKEIVAKAEEETKNEVKDGNNMEINISEIVAQAKKEAEVEMSTRMIYFEIGRMQKGQLIELAKDWMDTRNVANVERSVTIRATKYCMEYREAFDTEAQALNQLKAIKNDKFDKFLGILRDIVWICE